MKEYIAPASLAQAGQVLAIYEPYVKEGIATFEEQIPSLEDFRQRMADIMNFYPYLVYMRNNEMLGFAYANQYRSRPAWRWCVEISVYLPLALAGQGMGSRLSKALINMLKLMGIQNVYTCVALPNDICQIAHNKLGFEFLGVHRQAGCKFGQWIDVAWYFMSIGRHGKNPPEPTAFNQLPEAKVGRVLTSRK